MMLRTVGHDITKNVGYGCGIKLIEARIPAHRAAEDRSQKAKAVTGDLLSFISPFYPAMSARLYGNAY